MAKSSSTTTTKRQTRSSKRNNNEVDAALGLTSLSSPSASTENSDDDVPKKKEKKNEKVDNNNDSNAKKEDQEDTSPGAKTTNGDAVKETKTDPKDSTTEDNNNDNKPSSSAKSAALNNNNDNTDNPSMATADGMPNNMMGGLPYGVPGYPPGVGFDPAMMAHAMAAQNAAGYSSNGGDGLTTRTTNTKNFPETLFAVISDKENDHIISWLPHGKGFIVHDKKLFESEILPRYFDGAKFTSFTRRLKRWAFVRVPRGPELGAYYNTYFQRDKPDWVEKMRYRMEESQFSVAQSKDGMRSEQGKQFERELRRNEVERDAEKYASEKKRIEDIAANMVNDSLLSRPSLFGEDKMHEHQMKYVLAANISPETKRYFQLEGNRPMPLPSMLPRRAKGTKRNLAFGGMGYTGNKESDELRMMEMQREIMMGQRAHNDPYMFGYGGSMMLGATSSSARYGVPGGGPAFPSSNPTDKMSESEIGERIKQYQHVLGMGGTSSAGMMDYQSGYPGTQYSMPMGAYNPQLNSPDGSPKTETAGGDDAQAVVMSKEDKE